MDKDVIQGVIALLDEADKQIEGLTPKKANALLLCNCEDAVNALREALAKQPAPPPECKTDEEKTAFAFGWWKAMEENRKQPAPATELREHQEPVAHQYQDREGVWRDFINEKHYKDTVADGTWPIRSLCVCATPPESKPWVGLTETERKEIYRMAVYVDGAIRLAEAKLKEKNT